MDDEVRHRRSGPRFWLSAAAGWALIAVGLRGIFSHRLDTRPAQLARFVAGGALIHDLLLAPVVIAVGLVVAKMVTGRIRSVVQAALLATAVLALFAYPLVRAFGKATRNPTSVPRNYAANLAIVLVLVWTIAAAAVAIRLVRRKVTPK